MSDTPATPEGADPDALNRFLTLSSVLDEAKSVAAYEMPWRVQEQFLEFWQHSCIDHPEILDRLKPADPTRRNWQIVVTNAILGDVQEGVAALLYHLDEISRIESELRSKLEFAARSLHVDQPLFGAGGNVRRLDFAYQAHILAVRRTLEYFAGSVAAFFKRENPGFRSLPKKLNRAQPVELLESTLAALARHAHVHDRILSSGSDRSVRDRITHWNTVPAGVVNVQVYPSGEVRVFLAGGGEDLGASEAPELTALTRILDRAAGEVVQMIFDTYGAMGLMPDTPASRPQPSQHARP